MGEQYLNDQGDLIEKLILLKQHLKPKGVIVLKLNNPDKQTIDFYKRYPFFEYVTSDKEKDDYYIVLKNKVIEATKIEKENFANKLVTYLEKLIDESVVLNPSDLCKQLGISESVFYTYFRGYSAYLSEFIINQVVKRSIGEEDGSYTISEDNVAELITEHIKTEDRLKIIEMICAKLLMANIFTTMEDQMQYDLMTQRYAILIGETKEFSPENMFDLSSIFK